MTTQPEALRLAEALDRQYLHACEPAAAELRRLHAENEVMRNVANRGGHIAVAMSRIADLVAQRDALLEALKKAEENGCATVYSNEDDECGDKGCCGVVSYKPHADDCWVTTARAAIKAVEGENHAKSL
jgi:hypothetical protein